MFSQLDVPSFFILFNDFILFSYFFDEFHGKWLLCNNGAEFVAIFC